MVDLRFYYCSVGVISFPQSCAGLATKFLNFSTRSWVFSTRSTDRPSNYRCRYNGKSTAVTSLLSPVSTTLLDCREIPCGCVSFFSIPEAFSAGRKRESSICSSSSSSSFFPPKKSTLFSVQNIVCQKTSSYLLMASAPAGQSITSSPTWLAAILPFLFLNLVAET